MKQLDFEHGTVTGNILGAAVPMLVAQILNLLYNIVDRIYIARIPKVGTASIIPRTSTRNPTHFPLFEQIINEIGNFLSICREDSSLLFMAGSFAICIAALFIPRSGMKDPEHKTRSLASPLDKIDSVPLCTKSSRLSHRTKSNWLSTHIALSFLVIFG